MSLTIIITILATICVKFGRHFNHVSNLEFMRDPKSAESVLLKLGQSFLFNSPDIFIPMMFEQPAQISEETSFPFSCNLFLSDLNVLCFSRFDDFRFDNNNSAVKY